MRRDYEAWLRRQRYGDGTITAQLHRVGRIEQHYGDLDQHFERDGLRTLIAELSYSTEDERQRKPNPTKIPFRGNTRNNLASYKSAVLWYARFRGSTGTARSIDQELAIGETSSSRAAVSRRTIGRLSTAKPVPSIFSLGEDTLTLVRIAAKHCLLPHPNVVSSFGCAVFPAIRDQRNRLTLSEISGQPVLLDDNVTARWALLWSHGISATHHLRGFTFAHVWGAVKDPDAYTHLANLAMMPEYLASLSDKDGPFAHLLRFHAWYRYGWKPAGYPEPVQPEGFEHIKWRYLEDQANARDFVRERLATLKNQRTTLLGPLMERTHWWGE